MLHPASAPASDRRRPEFRRVKRGALGGLVALILGLAAALVPVHPAHAAEADTIHALVNDARSANGQPALVRNVVLDQVAAAWAAQMALADVLSHNPSYTGQIPAGWVRAAENVAHGQPTAAAMHDAWMSSSGHRANILGDFTDVGIAFLSVNGTTWGVEVFAAYPGHAAPPPVPAPSPTPAPADSPPPARGTASPPAPRSPSEPAPDAEEPIEEASDEESTTPVPLGTREARPTYRSSGGIDGLPALAHVERTAPSADGWLWVPVGGALLLAITGGVVVLRHRGLIGPSSGRHAD